MSGAKLKYIAFASMFIDHVNKAILYPNINGRTSLVISDLFDIIGRIAFPIFMFLLVEGYFKTKNRWKYLGYLVVFGIISEIPFDMFTSGTYYSPHWNNIMFTLAFTMVTIWIIDFLKAKKMPRIVFYLLHSWFCLWRVMEPVLWDWIMSIMQFWLDISFMFFVKNGYIPFYLAFCQCIRSRGLCWDLA